MTFVSASEHECVPSYELKMVDLDQSRTPDILVQCKCTELSKQLGCQDNMTRQVVTYEDGGSHIVTITKSCKCPENVQILRTVQPLLELAAGEKSVGCQSLAYTDEDITRTPRLIHHKSCTEEALRVGCQNLNINMKVKYEDTSEENVIVVSTDCVSSASARSLQSVLADMP